MNIRDLEYLVALADHRNFHRAAEACNVGQPTLSTQIRKLEEELGTSLIERAPRKLLLTPVGSDIVARARQILAELEELRQAAVAPAAGAGRLRLGVFPTLGPYMLPHVIQPLRARFPHIELLLTEEKSSALRQQLASGQLDAIVLADPAGNKHLSSMELFEEPFLLAVPDGHRLAQRDSVVPEDLRQEKLMLLEEGHCLRDQALAASHMAGAGEEKGFRATSLETLRQMVAAGVGVTFLPALASLGAMPLRGYSVLPLRGAGFSRLVSLHWRRTSPIGGLIETFGGIIASEIQPLIRGL